MMANYYTHRIPKGLPFESLKCKDYELADSVFFVLQALCNTAAFRTEYCVEHVFLVKKN